MCLRNPGNKDDEQVAVRQCGRIWRLHRGVPTRRENIERSKLAKEDQRQQEKNHQIHGGRQYDLSKKLRVHQHLPIQLLLWNILRVVRHKNRPGSVLVQKSGDVDDDVQFSALDAFYEMDGRKSRHIGEVLEWYGGEDAGGLKRSE